MSPRFALFTITNGVTACLMLAALSLLAVGAIGPLHSMVLAGAILWGRWRGRTSGSNALWDSVALIALVLFPIDLFVLSQSLIGSALRLLTFVVVYRCSSLTGRRELRQAVALSFVQILAAAASTTEVHFGILLAAYLSMVIWTLMAMASARDDAPAAARRAPTGRPVFLVTASTLALGAVLFLSIPHLGTGYLQQVSTRAPGGEALSGFSSRIELGSISRIKRSHTIVMRSRVVSGGRLLASSEVPRWRGLALDIFDGRSWSSGRAVPRWVTPDPDGWFHLTAQRGGVPPGDEQRGGGRPEAVRLGGVRPDRVEEISLEPSFATLMFAPPGALRLLSSDLATVGVDSAGSIQLQAPVMRRLTYRVESAATARGWTAGGEPAAGSGDADGELARCLALPRIDPRVAALAQQVTRDSRSDFERARLIEQHLMTDYAYSLQVDDAGVADPVAHFLIDKNPGHCEYFATAMAVMLRHLGVPARVVNGFVSGRWSDLARAYIVRQSDAHSWVEAWIPPRGWVTFDPTPPSDSEAARLGPLAALSRALDRVELAWDTWIVGLDLLDQRSLAWSLTDVARHLAAGARGAAADLASRLARGMLPTGSGWILILTGVMLVCLLARRAARGRAPVTGATDARAGAQRPTAATKLLRRFEARWAARGLRRDRGQTPLEFAREIERRALDTPGSALQFVEAYYRARYGPASNSTTA